VKGCALVRSLKISRDIKAERDILKLGIKGIASGVSGSEFNPDMPITRIDAVSLIMAIFEDPLSSQFGIKTILNLPFKDAARLPYETEKGFE